MFNDIDNFEGFLESLRLEEVLFRNEPSHMGDFLNSEDYYCQAWEALADLSDEYVELDWTSSTLYKFTFPGMVKFYDLCKEYGRKNKISFKRNPYVLGAEEFIKNAIDISCVRNFAWNLWLPKKIVKKKRYIFLIETGCYFEQHTEMLDLIYEVRDYYDRKAKELDEELHGKRKIIKMHHVGKEARKAA